MASSKREIIVIEKICEGISSSKKFSKNILSRTEMEVGTSTRTEFQVILSINIVFPSSFFIGEYLQSIRMFHEREEQIDLVCLVYLFESLARFRRGIFIGMPLK
jgi:hypothetical protein